MGFSGDDGAWHPVGIGLGQDGAVAGHHMQHIEQLALVFVDALDLHVEQAGRVHADAGGLVDQRGQALLVVGLHGPEFGTEAGVVGMRHQAAQQVQVTPPGAAQGAVDQLGEARVPDNSHIVISIIEPSG